MLHNLQERVALHDGHSMPGYGFGCYKVVSEAIREALKRGYRFIDSAAYYRNEPDVGRAIASGGLPREELFILSKIWPTAFDAPEKALEQTLRDLGVDFLDCYLLHWPGTSESRRFKAYEALLRFQEQGKIRSIGVSNFLQIHLEGLHRQFGQFPVVNEIEMHPYYQQKELRAWCAANNIRIIAWSPIGRSAPLEHPTIVTLSRALGKTPTQIVLRWHVEHGSIPIPKSNHAERIQENSAVFDFQLDADAMVRIDNLDRHQPIGADPMTYTGD